MGSLGMSWAVLASLGHVWGVLWARLGASEGVLEVSWGHPGASEGGSWSGLGQFWRLSETIFKDFCEIFCDFELYVEIAKNLEKPMVFQRFSRFW